MFIFPNFFVKGDKCSKSILKNEKLYAIMVVKRIYVSAIFIEGRASA